MQSAILIAIVAGNKHFAYIYDLCLKRKKIINFINSF